MMAIKNNAVRSAGGGGRFRFNGTDFVNTAYQGFTVATEGAYSFMSRNDDDGSTSRDAVAANAVLTARYHTSGKFRVISFNTGTTTSIFYTLGADHDVRVSWPAGGQTTFYADGDTDVVNSGSTELAVPVAIGGLSNNTNTRFIGAIWDVKIFADEAMNTLLHHWPMDEGVGLVFNDIVGGDNLTFDAGMGDWE